MRRRTGPHPGSAPHGSRRFWRAAALVTAMGAAAGALSGCDQPPSPESLKEWAPGDHHSSDDDKVAAGMEAKGKPQPKGGDATQLVELAWRSQCTSCHGPMGKGDGQMGPMVNAPDLTREDLQSKVTDQELAAIIKGGRNRMPKFDTLPDPVILGLVDRIRQLRGH